MLAGHNHSVDPDEDAGPALERVLGGHLGLGVWPRPPEAAVPPELGYLLVHLVGQLQGERHALLRLVSRVPEHQTLVPGAGVVCVLRRPATALGPSCPWPGPSSSTWSLS